MTVQKQECIELIKSFINERLDGDIQKFHDYDLDQLERDEKYGAYDPDNSKIANAIYVVLWGDILPNLTMDTLGEEMYRGDTMNSFNTLMGRPNEDGTNFLGIQKYTHDSKIVNMAKKYHEKYHTIGNLMVLPNKMPESERTTLNQLRGGGAWYDYFDLFLTDIRDLMLGTNIEKIDNRLKNLVDINKHFFDCFQGTDGFSNFCRTFYLDKYVDLRSLNVHNIFSPYARHWPTKYGEAEYKRYVTAYITKATEIIDYRCSRMIEDLEKEILKYDPTFKVSSKDNKQQANNQSTSKNTNARANIFQKYIAQFKDYFRQDIFESTGVLLLILILTICAICSIFQFVRFIKIGGYNPSPSFTGSPADFYNNSTFSTLLVTLFSLSALVIEMSYVKNHTGTKKILMILFLVFQFFIYTMPITFTAIPRILGNSEWLVNNYRSDLETIMTLIDVGVKLYPIAWIIGSVIPFIILLFESRYRLFVKRWGVSFLICFILIPLTLTLLKYKIIAYLVGIAVLGYLLIATYSELKYAIEHKCPSCGKLSGLRRVSKELLREEKISILVTNDILDEAGKRTGTTQQYIPGTREVFVESYYCRNCGHSETRTVTEDKKNI